ncbi:MULTISPECIES: hypothetical protein [unclassified Streptomyces]|uniref:hypothetical protein n=1 Tax=unclassified Streptomyces TaxID=2593676 RepID=UPI002252CDA1|nr:MULTISPECIES: hypothetical protein [unclassified Streptomyces]MCX4789078.1 hypothetical protein [Streptomyces sp. NBC_01221]MCX4795176.1 hypothetical protein [Streptomyces sp. NBC_01242]WSP57263.1 hypothetical protein OG306_24930 [Streptomyces sp. NBC_01241]WSP62910.1 hypothetical protein OG466_14215 [Streptomyces sp. NBC_01240]
MGRLTVTFRKWEAQYFPAGELVRADEPIAGFDELEDRLLADHPRMRRILIRLRPGWPLLRYYLHWSDGTDLVSLDRRVAAGTATEEDFAGAVVGEPHYISHPACGAKFRVIEWDVAVPLFSNGVERSRAHSYCNECPACGGHFDTNALEFITPETS